MTCLVGGIAGEHRKERERGNRKRDATYRQLKDISILVVLAVDEFNGFPYH